MWVHCRQAALLRGELGTFLRLSTARIFSSRSFIVKAFASCLILSFFSLAGGFLSGVVFTWRKTVFKREKQTLFRAWRADPGEVACTRCKRLVLKI